MLLSSRLSSTFLDSVDLGTHYFACVLTSVPDNDQRTVYNLAIPIQYWECLVANSLQQQLLQAGLANKKQASKINKEKAKQNKQARKHKVEIVDEAKVAAEKARQQQVERDRELNRQRQQEAEQKALKAQAKNIVQHSEIKREDGDVGFNFSHAGVIKKIYISQKQWDELARGQLAITEIDDRYALVPANAAYKIQERLPDYFVQLAQKQEVDEDDPYKDYQIPDDLMW